MRTRTTGGVYNLSSELRTSFRAEIIEAAVSTAMEVPGALSFVAIQEKIASEPARHFANSDWEVRDPSMISVSVRAERSGMRVRSFDFERTKMRIWRSRGGKAMRVRIMALPVEPVPPRTVYVGILLGYTE